MGQKRDTLLTAGAAKAPALPRPCSNPGAGLCRAVDAPGRGLCCKEGGVGKAALGGLALGPEGALTGEAMPGSGLWDLTRGGS